MATTVASIMVGNLTSDALYVDHLVCEVYADNLLTDLVAQDTATVKNVSGVWTQQGVMSFTGLTLGATYYLRAGVAAPLSDTITWSSTFSIQAGTSTLPAPEFIFQSTKTASGVSYVVTPSVVPTNIDHYDAWWAMDTTAPTQYTAPMWSGRLNSTTFFSFFIGCTSAQTPTVYVRAVNTSAVPQTWQELEVTSGGTLDNVTDGTSYVKNAQYANGVVAVPNGNFEADTTLPGGVPSGWANGSALVGPPVTCSYDTATPYSGTQSLKVVATATYGGIISTQKFALVPGDSWKLSGALKSISGDTASIQLGFIGATGAYVGSTFFTTTSTSWQYDESSAIVPAGAVYGILFCQMLGAHGGVGEFDSVQLIRLANLDTEVLDGTTYVRLADVNSDHTFHKSSALNPQGSLTQLSMNTFQYDYTTTSITWGWGAYDIYTPDGNVTTIGASTAPAFTGLTAGDTYYFSFYYDITGSQTVVLLSDVNSGKSPSSLQQQAQVVNGDGHVPINVNVTATTSTSGGGSGGGGGGGGGGTCFTPDTLVLTDQGNKRIVDVHVGDRVLTARKTWRSVTYVTSKLYTGPMLAMGDPNDGVTPGHLFLRDTWVRASEVYDKSFAYSGTIHNLHIGCAERDDGSGKDTEHSYTLANGEVVHNLLTYFP